MEYWKEFEKGYEVSNLGNVRSVDRIVYTSKQPLKLKGKMLKPAIDKKGYKRVAIMVIYRDWETDRKSTRLNSSHLKLSRMPSSA